MNKVFKNTIAEKGLFLKLIFHDEINFQIEIMHKKK